MPWTSVLDSLPEEGAECLLSCMKADGSMVEAIGYWQDGKWVIETGHLEERDVRVRHWMPFTSARKIG